MVLGVVAAITVPSLMNNINGQEYRSKVKKAISSVNQALILNYALEGLSVRDYSNTEDLVNNLFKKRMNVIDVDYSTFPDDYSIGFDCYPDSTNSFVTVDGTIFCVYGIHKYNSFCDTNNKLPCYDDVTLPNLYIDINGLKGPNKESENSSQPSDIHYALIYNTKIEPWGLTRFVMRDIDDVHVRIPESQPPAF